ncbi:MAG: hypothetical protein ETSY1_22810 [Candidatus Entotheonella factor]|uniref:PIN domain-containing protein n=1 Tax=Entotheonella factor TaxID=1429438 RepID=W4LHE1_ENTF1|nr:MAG: hypothetical protein ETSY1_22810 [Candidatus Entotheonella factor]
MRLLLDTHTFLWFLLDDPSLSATAKALIIDPDNDIDISPATYLFIIETRSIVFLLLRP